MVMSGAEHEISGDVLLEFDINTLKEIDLPAFGRRVHIFNAIKELRRQIEPMGTSFLSSSQGFGSQYSNPVSPTMSGYIPDTPSSQANFSPMDAFSPNVGRMSSSGNFAMQQAQVLAASDISTPDRRISEPNPIADDRDPLHGLGFQDDGSRTTPQKAATVVSPDCGQRPLSHRTQGFSASRPTTGKSNKTAGSHKRSHTDGTVDTYHTVPSGDLTEVAEEAEILQERQVVTDVRLTLTTCRR
jgi:hypothetical protein